MTNAALPQLSDYAQIQKLFSADFQNRYYQAHQHAPDYLFAILCEPGDKYDGYRQELEDLLAVGARLGLLDPHMAGRLTSGDPDGLYSVLAELEAAKFLDGRGFAVSPAPTGSPGRVGDMMVNGDPPIFVEIKAVLDRSEEAKEGRVISGLVRYAEPVFDEFDDPVLVVFTVISGGGFNRRHLERWLRRTFSERAETDKSGADGEFVYESHDGLRLAMRLASASGLEHPAMMSMNTKDNPPIADYLSASIEKAYSQLPDDGTPSLVIIRDFLSLRARDKHVMAALFGKRVWNVNFMTKTFEETYSGAGLLAPGKRERLSAVGYLDVRRPTIGPQTTKLSVFHNPWTRYPLDAATLSGADIRHLVQKDGKMVWVGDEDSAI